MLVTVVPHVLAFSASGVNLHRLYHVLDSVSIFLLARDVFRCGSVGFTSSLFLSPGTFDISSLLCEGVLGVLVLKETAYTTGCIGVSPAMFLSLNLLFLFRLFT